MRLICPNCGAQYEVDAAMIPDEGRDVQCSNCGKTWFQESEEAGALPPAFEAADALAAADSDPVPAAAPEEAAPAPDATEEPPEAPAAVESEPEPEPDSEPEPVQAEAPAPSVVTPLPERPLAQTSEEAMDILREEADREIRARRSETPGSLESQQELGLTERIERARERRRLAAQAAEAETETEAEEDIAPEDLAAQAESRSGLLPDIDEINSSLSPSEGPGELTGPEAAAAAEASRRAGFRLGFGIMMLVAILLVAGYAYAPSIARSVPAAEPFVIAYVDLANAARAGIDNAMARSAERLSGIVGSE